jgi:hypothetical protein
MVKSGASYRALVLLSLLVIAAAKPWRPSEYPNPQVDLKKCGRRGVKSFICDPDGVLSYADANAVEGLISKIAYGEPPFLKAPCGELGLRGYQVGCMHLQVSNDKPKHRRVSLKTTSLMP